MQKSNRGTDFLFWFWLSRGLLQIIAISCRLECRLEDGSYVCVLRPYGHVSFQPYRWSSR